MVAVVVLVEVVVVVLVVVVVVVVVAVVMAIAIAMAMLVLSIAICELQRSFTMMSGFAVTRRQSGKVAPLPSGNKYCHLCPQGPCWPPRPLEANANGGPGPGMLTHCVGDSYTIDDAFRVPIQFSSRESGAEGVPANGFGHGCFSNSSTVEPHGPQSALE